MADHWITAGIWVFATAGWLLDWLSTVWPSGAVVERNPLVVGQFGRRPDPRWFGLAKLASLVAFFILFRLLDVLVSLDGAVPATVAGLRTALFLPLGVGVLGWGVSLHNLRVHWQARQK